MHNPLIELTLQALIGLINKGYFYWVRQTYPQGLAAGVKESFIMTPYTDLAQAQVHYEQIKDDPRLYLYRLSLTQGQLISDDPDGEKLIAASKHPAGYRVYLPFMRAEWTASRELKEQIHEGAKRIGLGSRKTKADSQLTLLYGRLNIRYTYKKQSVYIPLEEIEKY